MGGGMKILCPSCQSKSYIFSRKDISGTLSRLYCQCRDLHCGNKFVYILAFDHIIESPPVLSREIAEAIVRALPRSDLEMLVQLSSER